MLDIDGSLLEGGGQILRIAIGLSALTKRPVRIFNIRAGRKKPGLAAQHLNGIQLTQSICNAQVKGLHIGSTEIEFKPGRLKGGEYTADTRTAGSIALLFQVSLPLVLFGDSPSTLHLRGGTNADMAPQIDFTTEIFRPHLEKFGATFDFILEKRGYFPKGGGYCKLTISPVRALNAMESIEFGELKEIFGWSYVAGSLPIHVADEMMNGAKSEIRRACPNKAINIESYKESLNVARDNGSGIVLGCHTTTNCTLGGSAINGRNQKPFETGQKAANELIDVIRAKSCVDTYIQDQLIIFMALAKGVSRIRCSFPLTLHTQTAIYITELMTKAKFTIIEQSDTCIIQCNGIGYENTSFQ